MNARRDSIDPRLPIERFSTKPLEPVQFSRWERVLFGIADMVQALVEPGVGEPLVLPPMYKAPPREQLRRESRERLERALAATLSEFPPLVTDERPREQPGDD